VEIEMLKLSKHQQAILTAVSKRSGKKPEEYLLELLLTDYKRIYRKDYLLN
jgi:hypothetical protein